MTELFGGVRSARRITVAVATLLLTVPCSALDLAGAHPFRVGDDLTWAQPDYDDSHWTHAYAPAGWVELAVDPGAEVAWRRIRIDQQRLLAFDQPALLGRIQMAVEIYLNGELIHRRGTIGAPGPRARVLYPAGRLIVAPLPRGLIRTGENVIALRMARLRHIDNGGIASGPFEITELLNATRDYEEQTGIFWLVDGVQLTMNLAIVISAMAMLALGLRDRTMVLLLVSGSLWTITSLRWTHFVADNDWVTPIVAEICTSLQGISVAVHMEFLAAVMAVRVGAIGRGIQVLIVLSMFPVPEADGGIGGLWRDYAYPMWTLLTGVALLWVVWTATGVIRAGHRVGWTVLLLYAALVGIPVIWGVANPTGALLDDIGKLLDDVMIQLYVVCLALLGAYRIVDLERQRREAQASALQAQQEERARLARELHDGLGQSLSAARLRMQLLAHGGADDRNQELSALVDEFGNLVDESRRISHDLAPAFVTHRGLLAAVSDHARSVTTYQGVEVVLHLDESAGFGDPRDEHLYRIVQEALRNAIRHGQATRIEVELQAAGSTLVLTVDDDGVGMISPGPGNFSLGLRSIAERAELLGGNARLEPRAAGGMRLTVTAKR